MILEEMYSGRFYPCETVVPTSEVYRKAVKACENLMEQLSQRLSKENSHVSFFHASGIKHKSSCCSLES